MISNAAGIEEVQGSLAGLWAEVKQESVCEWIENNVEIPTGEVTGKVQLDYIPYSREILERFTDRRTKHVVMVFPTQSGKTSILIMGMLYRIARDPRDALWVMGNTEQVRAFNKERMMPYVHLCPAVLDLVPRTQRGVIDRHFWGFQNHHYKSMTLNFVGAGSATNLKSRPRAVVVMDEVDSYAEEMGPDSGAIQLVEERQKTFSFPLSVKASSPTLDGRGISAEYLKTDMRKFWVPCPRCEQMILLEMKVETDKHGDCGLRWWHQNEKEAQTDGSWDFQKVKALAHYKCQACGGMIHDFERRDILQGGEWRPQNPRAPMGRHGYQINSLYSILGPETSLASIAAKFLMAQGLRSDLKTFINDWLAEPWDESKSYSHKKVELRAFAVQEIPDDAVSLMAVDVQAQGYWVLVRKFQRPSSTLLHGQSWLLEARYVQSVEELVDIQKEFGVLGENVTLDMAHKPNAVGRIIIENDWRGIWGSDTPHFYHPQSDGTRITRPYSVTQFRDTMLGTAWEGRTAQRARFVYFCKAAALDMVSSLRYSPDPIWHCTINVAKDYVDHLNSRVKRQQKNKRTGRTEWVWFESHQRNHLADCESHVTIRALMAGLLSLPNESEQQNVPN